MPKTQPTGRSKCADCLPLLDRSITSHYCCEAGASCSLPMMTMSRPWVLLTFGAVVLFSLSTFKLLLDVSVHPEAAKLAADNIMILMELPTTTTTTTTIPPTTVGSLNDNVTQPMTNVDDSVNTNLTSPPDTTTTTTPPPPQKIDSLNDAPGQRFAPGTLDTMTKVDTIARCWVGNKTHGWARRNKMLCAHVPNITASNTTWPQHKTILLAPLLAKVGSSSIRKMIRSSFPETPWYDLQRPCQDIVDRNATYYFAATREPLDRFISGYKEVVLARAHLYGKPNHIQKVSKIPEKYARFAEPLQALSDERLRDLLSNATTENMQFNARLFDQFIKDWDHRIFDVHLSLQTQRLWSSGDSFERFDLVVDVEDLSDAMYELGHAWGWKKPPHRTLKGRPSLAPSFLDPAHFSNETIQKICRFAARDYCCLNYVLPEACQGVVECEWAPNPRDDGTGIRHVVL